jgi:hypothetical protein
MVTVNCSSDALDACDPTEFGGITLEETDKWVRFLNDSMESDGGASEKVCKWHRFLKLRFSFMIFF